MPYLVDGHNLIPKVGLHLEQADDEVELLARLQEFCRRRGARLEVFFDGAPPGQAGRRQAGAVVATFVRLGSSADAAIEARLAALGRQARNWTVVSSDGRVRAAARAAHAGLLSAEEFALLISQSEAVNLPGRAGESPLSPQEVEEWLRFFDRKRG